MFRIAAACAVLGLASCGGGGIGPAGNTPAVAAHLAALGSTTCKGAVKELFTAAQGTYEGVVDAGYSTGTTLPLTKGKSYAVSLSGGNCSIMIAGDNNEVLVYSYDSAANVSSSTLTGFSLSQITKNPATLELDTTQYNVSISTSKISLELERRTSVNATDAGVVTGDLYLSTYGPDGEASVYALPLPLTAKH